MKKMKFLLSLSTALAFVAAPAYAQVVTPIINDSFADGSPVNSGLPLETAFHTTSSTSALSDDPVTPPVLDFATGSSGRAIHTTFSPVALNTVGDQLAVSYTFTTPATVGTNEDFRVGLFNTGGAPEFSDNINASSGDPNPVLNIPGLSGEFDINPANADADIAVRTHNVNGLDYDQNGTVDGDEVLTGRLLTTTNGFDPRGSQNPDPNFAIAPNTSYTGGLIVELDADGDLIVTQTLVGGAVNETFTATLAIDDDVVGQVPGVNTSTFDFLGFSVTSDAFGSVNNTGEPDNGLDFTNITVTSTTAAVVPEPSSAALLLGGLLSMGVIRRRRN